MIRNKQNKKNMLKALGEITEYVKKGEITDLAIMGYGDRAVHGGLFTDPIIGYGLVKRLERSVIKSHEKAEACNALEDILKHFPSEDDE